MARYALAGRPVLVGLLCGLAVLVRPDMAVPAGLLVLVLLPWRRWMPVASVAALVCLPWHVFSWRFLGGFVPDTTWIKTNPAGATMASVVASWYAPVHTVAKGIRLEGDVLVVLPGPSVGATHADQAAAVHRALHCAG